MTSIYNANCRITAYNNAVSDYEDDLDLLLFVCLLLENEKNAKRRSSHKLYKERNVEGAHYMLINRYLMDDETKFQQYFRLTPHLFKYIFEIVKKDLHKSPTTWVRKPIPAHFKLCITLR